MSSVGAEAKLCCCNAIAGNNMDTTHYKKVAVLVWWNRNRKKQLAEELIFSSRRNASCWWGNKITSTVGGGGGRGLGGFAASVVLLIMILNGTVGNAATLEQNLDDTLSNIPQTLSGEDSKKARIQRPKSRDAERCTVKCVTTCIRGGAGSPGEGPLNARRPLVVFKEGFHSRKYCLVECSDICNLIKDGEDGP